MPILNFRDLLTLSLMVSHIKSYGAAPRQRDLFDDTTVYRETNTKTVKAGALNKKIVDEQIPPVYADTVSGFKQIDQIMQRLRAAGLLVPRDPLFKRAPYQVTDEGEAVIEALPKNWREWPLQIRVEGGVAHWNEALHYG